MQTPRPKPKHTRTHIPRDTDRHTVYICSKWQRVRQNATRAQLIAETTRASVHCAHSSERARQTSNIESVPLPCGVVVLSSALTLVSSVLLCICLCFIFASSGVHTKLSRRVPNNNNELCIAYISAQPPPPSLHIMSAHVTRECA